MWKQQSFRAGCHKTTKSTPRSARPLEIMLEHMYQRGVGPSSALCMRMRHNSVNNITLVVTKVMRSWPLYAESDLLNDGLIKMITATGVQHL